jgi:3-dehydrosphinganine reductase
VSFEGKRVLISGGSMGTGRALALALAAAGAHVCVVARGAEALEQTVADMVDAARDRDTVLTSRSVDVTDVAAVEALAADVVPALGGLDLLVCNQGFARAGLVPDVPAAEFGRMLDVNFLGHAYLCRAFAPSFVKQGSGTVVLVASVLGYLGTYGYAPYAASKWAIVGFAECFRQEMGLHGVQVKVVYPGTIETPGLERENADKPKVVWEMESGSPFNKIRSADEVARLILRAADGSRFENPLGWDGRFTFWASRHLPWLVRRLNDSDLRQAIRKHG